MEINQLPEAIIANNTDWLIIQTTGGITQKISRANFLAGISSSIPQNTNKELIYSSDGDTNGLFYWLGTNKGTTSFSNPHPSKITLKAGNPIADLSLLADRQAAGNFYTDNVPNTWIGFQLNSGSFKCNKYSIRAREYDSSLLRSWKFQAKDVDGNWIDLDVQNNNQSVTQASQWLTLPASSTDFYSDFRIQTTGANSTGTYHITAGELEFYGEYKE